MLIISLPTKFLSKVGILGGFGSKANTSSMMALVAAFILGLIGYK